MVVGFLRGSAVFVMLDEDVEVEAFAGLPKPPLGVFGHGILEEAFSARIRIWTASKADG
jgi:hypothetical protein